MAKPPEFLRFIGGNDPDRPQAAWQGHSQFQLPISEPPGDRKLGKKGFDSESHIVYHGEYLADGCQGEVFR